MCGYWRKAGVTNDLAERGVALMGVGREGPGIFTHDIVNVFFTKHSL